MNIAPLVVYLVHDLLLGALALLPSLALWLAGLS